MEPTNTVYSRSGIYRRPSVVVQPRAGADIVTQAMLTDSHIAQSVSIGSASIKKPATASSDLAVTTASQPVRDTMVRPPKISPQKPLRTTTTVRRGSAKSQHVSSAMPTTAELYASKRALRVKLAQRDSGSTIRKRKKRSSADKTSKMPTWPLYVLAGLTILIGGALAVQAYIANQAVEEQVEQLTAMSGVDDPGLDNNDDGNSAPAALPTDKKPADPNFIDNYTVAPDAPRVITIDSIGVRARVLQVGIDSKGRVDVPKTAYDTAWYQESVNPGSLGAALINGHVQGVGGGAIFTRLKDLGPGSEVTIEKGDGSRLVFVVKTVETVPLDEVDMAKMLVSADAGKPGLNLITCGGDYDTTQRTFKDRTLVRAVLK